MRIHFIIKETVEDFFTSYDPEKMEYTFNTRAVFNQDEECILEFFFNSYAEIEHFRVKIVKMTRLNNNTNTIVAQIQSKQKQKINFLKKLSSDPNEWISQRTHRRHPVQINASWSLEKPSLWHPCEIKDLGLGGAQITGSTSPPINSQLFVRFLLPNLQSSVKLKGEVVWNQRENSGNSRVGVRFLRNNPKQNTKKAFKKLRQFFRDYRIHGKIDGKPE
ncbi:MAG: PilZ domain-containing protein [Myxococcota bacterium]